MFKNQADIKTLIWLVAMTVVWIWNWSTPELSWIPFLLSCFGAVLVTSMVHNHVHLSVFKLKTLNVLYDYWLSVFYGYPVFAWISTHNKNHHVYNNKDGDFVVG